MATNYDINYNDDRFKSVESKQSATLNEIDETYGNMIANSEKSYDKLIQASENWKNQQIAQQNEQNALTIEQINQQKDQAKKDYTNEQSGAYVDWKKQSGKYGANAEAMAAQGMTGTGFSESSQVSMYNTYQNRVATAREAYSRAVLNYDNSIKEAMLQNSSILAEIAHKAFVEQTELALNSLQYKNQLLDTMYSKQMEAKQFYANEYQRVLDQMNTENALAEDIRQFNQLHPSIDSSGVRIDKGSSSSNSDKPKFSAGTGVLGIAGNKTSDTEEKVDMESVLSLGFGRISASKAYDLVQRGIAETYTKNGKTYFRLSPKALKEKQMGGIINERG